MPSDLTPADRALLAGRYKIVPRALTIESVESEIRRVWIVILMDEPRDVPAFLNGGRLPIYATEDGAKRGVQRKVAELYLAHPELRP